jgi:hypothetical protein
VLSGIRIKICQARAFHLPVVRMGQAEKLDPFEPGRLAAAKELPTGGIGHADLTADND